MWSWGGVRRVSGHAWENGSVAWKWSILMIFGWFFTGCGAHLGQDSVQSEIFPMLVPSDDNSSNKLFITVVSWWSGVLRGLIHDKKWGFFCNFWLQIGLKQEVVVHGVDIMWVVRSCSGFQNSVARKIASCQFLSPIFRN